MRTIFFIVILLLSVILMGCKKDDVILESPSPSRSTRVFEFSLKGSPISNGLKSNIRIMAFDKDNEFVTEYKSIPLENINKKDSVELPAGKHTLLFLGNAGTQGVQHPIFSPLDRKSTRLNSSH